MLVRGAADLAGSYAVLLVLAVLGGVLVGARQIRVEAMRRSAVLEERLRIARDLHDVVGHGLGAITVQAGTGRMALAAGADDEVRRALLSIEQAGRGMLREVRWLVGVLRDRPDEVNLGDLPALADAARGAGFDVRMTVDGDLGSVPQPTGEASYRIVQEALTNAFRHSGSESVWVRVNVGDVLTVLVLDKGTAGPAAEGHGIRGMRERAAAVGGELCVGPPADGPGWEVRATLPMRGSRR
jgi:signal transduction histidine kinase